MAQDSSAALRPLLVNGRNWPAAPTIWG